MPDSFPDSSEDSTATTRDVSGSRPVFIVGALRSGTTMLRLMLDAHPQICIFGEFEYGVKYARGNDFPTAREYARLLEVDRVFLAHGFDLPEGQHYEEMVRAFLRQAAERSGKPIVGATIHSRFDLVRRVWPNARFIHLLRDPRDVARSCIGMGWVGNVWYGADIWLDAERRWDTVVSELPAEDYCELKFEQLVESPITELSKVCQFLEVPLDDQMLSYPESTTYEAPDAKLANQWMRKLSQAEICEVEAKCGVEMERRGYARHGNGQIPSLVRRALLGLQTSYARKAFNVRRYGPALYAQWQIAKRLRHTESDWARRVLLKKAAVDSARVK